MRTPICDELGIEFPIFAFTHCRDVVVAVSKAGGFGVLGAVGFSPEQLEIELNWIDEHIGDRPYGVDIVIPNKYEGQGADSSAEELGDMLRSLVPQEHLDFARNLLVDDIVAIDLSPTRLALAHEIGAAHTIDPTTTDVWAELKRIHGEAPFMFGPTAATDVFIEASGADSVIGDVLQHGRFGGRLSIVALHYRPVPTNYVNLLMKQFTIRGSFEYPERFEDAVELLARRDLSAVITHAMPLEDFGQGLSLLENSKDCGKVMITIGDVE